MITWVRRKQFEFKNFMLFYSTHRVQVYLDFLQMNVPYFSTNIFEQYIINRHLGFEKYFTNIERGHTKQCSKNKEL